MKLLVRRSRFAVAAAAPAGQVLVGGRVSAQIVTGLCRARDASEIRLIADEEAAAWNAR